MLQQWYFKLMSRFFPKQVAQQVYRVLSNPRRRRLRDSEEVVLAKAQQERIPFEGFEIQTYAWGNPEDPLLLLIHGWEGQAGNFAALVPILLEKGYYVLAFDGPAHGKSSIQPTSMFQYAALIEQFLKTRIPSAIISHSFGSVTALLALSKHQDLKLAQLIMVTTPYNFKDRIKEVQDYLGVHQKAMDLVVEKIEAQSDLRVADLNMESYKSKLNHVDELLIIHSKADRVLPIEGARKTAQAFQQAILIELEKLGHYSILWSKQLQQIIQEQLNVAN